MFEFLKRKKPAIGEVMKDGSVFAGISPDTGKRMYTTPQDSPLRQAWDDAKKYASELRAHGRKDWRMPTQGELRVLFNNRAAIKNFDVDYVSPKTWYWSSTVEKDAFYARVQCFSNSVEGYNPKHMMSSLRCVRG